MNEQKTLNIEDIRFMLSNGMTRKIDDKNYNAELGSIQEHYNLSADQITLAFRDERLKGIRFKKVAMPMFILDEGERTIETLPRMNNTTISTTVTATEELVEGIFETEEVEF